jgi:hypothetical protein
MPYPHSYRRRPAAGSGGTSKAKRKPTTLDFVEVDGDQPAATDRPLTDYQIVAALADLPELPARAGVASLHSALQRCIWEIAVVRLRLLGKTDGDSKRTNAGFPDLFLIGPGGISVMEIKVDRAGAAPRFEPEQPVWLRAFGAIAILTHQVVRCRVVTPADYYAGGPIMQDLAAISRPPTRTRPLALPTVPLRGRTLR